MKLAKKFLKTDPDRQFVIQIAQVGNYRWEEEDGLTTGYHTIPLNVNGIVGLPYPYSVNVKAALKIRLTQSFTMKNLGLETHGLLLDDSVEVRDRLTNFDGVRFLYTPSADDNFMQYGWQPTDLIKIQGVRKSLGTIKTDSCTFGVAKDGAKLPRKLSYKKVYGNIENMIGKNNK
jgi:hypothetical protein